MELNVGIQNGTFKILIDVRSQNEWNSGHLENATLAENLASDGIDPPPEVLSCLELGNCPIVVYCRSGARAGAAIERLIQLYGANGDMLYNGQGVSQWTSAGLPLDMSLESKDPMCEKRNNNEQCEQADDMNEDVMTQPPSSPPVISLSADELYEGMVGDQFDIVIDVRSIEEFREGHIENVTFIEGLATEGVVPEILLYQQMSEDDSDTTEVMPTLCRYTACHIAVTCRSGSRAGAAIDRLRNEFNFTQTQFYNGGGTFQWEQAGYPLVTTLESVIPRCAAMSEIDNTVLSTRNATLDGMDEDGNCYTCCKFRGVMNETAVDVNGLEDVLDDSEASSKDVMNSIVALMAIASLLA
jgi:rhodanese-related sulfurtransferase